MSTQTGLRDLGRNNASDWRSISLKKGAAPPLHRSSAKASTTAASVHATFISPPRNTPAVPQTNNNSSVSYSSVPARSMNSENVVAPQAVYSANVNKFDHAAPSVAYSSDLEASLPSGLSDAVYPNMASGDRGTHLRSISDVPVLSLGGPEGSGPTRATDPYAMHVSVASRGSHRSPVPMARPAVAFTPSATPEDEVVAAFMHTCVGRVVEAACTPQGKALLVAALETEREEVLCPVVAEVCQSLGDIAVDAQGCHVLRTLVEACTPEQTEELIAAMYPSVILNICTTSQHTRLTLQSLFERRLVDLWPVVDVLAANAGYLAATQQGCISLMRVFERSDVEQKSALVHELLPKFAALSMDAFANYMVQCAIEHSDRTTAAQYVVQLFAGHLLQMSCDKFASNVVEKVVRVCGGVPAVRRLLLDELIFNPAALKELVSDSYGNFVVQSVIEATTNAMEMKRVEDRLRPALVGCPFAAKIESKLKAKRPGQSHGAAGNAHHHHQQQQQPQPQSQQQQQRRSSYVNHHSTANLYGGSAVTVGVHPQIAQAVPQRSSSYRIEAPQVTAVVANSFRHRPYETQAVVSPTPVTAAEAMQRFYDANAHLRSTPTAQGNVTAAAVSAQVPPADYFKFPILGSRSSGSGEAEAEDSGPVYGPSPAARRHLQQQQQFRPPFTGAL